MISDIPPFDLQLGYELYSTLLKPVEAGWKQSKSLILATNGALHDQWLEAVDKSCFFDNPSEHNPGARFSLCAGQSLRLFDQGGQQ
jgi:hypothetical protein